MDGGYDIGYKACACFWGREPGSLVHKLQEVVGGFDYLSVLDVGCGEGKNAAYLAARGASVRALDISQYAIANAKSTWPDTSSIVWEVADIRRIELGLSQYDIVLAYGLLHCMRGRDEIAEVIHKIQVATRPGGYNIVCALNDREQDLTAHPGFQPCLLPHDYYTSLYHHWSLLECTDSDLVESHPHNQIVHTHSLTRFIARSAASA